MRSLRRLVLVGIVTLAGVPAAANPILKSSFAISCEGDATFESVNAGRSSSSTDPSGRQVFVIDESQHVVFRALFPRQEYDPICGASEAHISPGRITIFSVERDDRSSTICELSIDRQAGTAEYILNIDFENGRAQNMKWTMDCERTEIPIFDTSRNKL
jgi:hypothetical protein